MDVGGLKSLAGQLAKDQQRPAKGQENFSRSLQLLTSSSHNGRRFPTKESFSRESYTHFKTTLGKLASRLRSIYLVKIFKTWLWRSKLVVVYRSWECVWFPDLSQRTAKNMPQELRNPDGRRALKLILCQNKTLLASGAGCKVSLLKLHFLLYPIHVFYLRSSLRNLQVSILLWIEKADLLAD